ncbi:hypothetical protein [Pseudomonas purpurea]|uniref:hypothetical protein n=1 Tax=Pseudomonas purpurea TaxID=3136737 RepID=UPI0032633B3E
MNNEQREKIEEIRRLISSGGRERGILNSAYPAAPFIPLLNGTSMLAYRLIVGETLAVVLSYEGMKEGDRILFYCGGATPGISDFECSLTLMDGRRVEVDVPKEYLKRLIKHQAFAVYFVNGTQPSNFTYFDVIE